MFPDIIVVCVHLEVLLDCFSIKVRVLDICVGLMSRVFANGPGDRDSIPGRVIPKTRKMVLDATLLNTQYYIKFGSRVSGAIQEKE